MGPLYFKDSPINFDHQCELLGIILSSSRTTDNVIENNTVMNLTLKEMIVLI